MGIDDMPLKIILAAEFFFAYVADEFYAT